MFDGEEAEPLLDDDESDEEGSYEERVASGNESDDSEGRQPSYLIRKETAAKVPRRIPVEIITHLFWL